MGSMWNPQIEESGSCPQSGAPALRRLRERWDRAQRCRYCPCHGGRLRQSGQGHRRHADAVMNVRLGSTALARAEHVDE